MSFLYRLRLALLRNPRVIEAPLGEGFQSLLARMPDLAESESPSEWDGCSDYKLELPDYVFHAIVKDGIVVGVIHNTDRYRDTGIQRVKKLFHFLDAYSSGSTFEQILDNGFGLTYKSKDGKVTATHSYVCDIFSAYRSELIRKEAAAQGSSSEQPCDLKTSKDNS